MQPRAHHFEAMLGTSSINFDGTSSIVLLMLMSIFDDLEHAWLDNTTNKDGAKMSIDGSEATDKKDVLLR
jgi:hypothetical protein